MVSLRPALVLSSLLALIGGLVVALVGTAGTAGAATWKRVDRNCMTTVSGTACVETYRSSAGGWRGVVRLDPKPGQWMQPVSGLNFATHQGGDFNVCGSGSCGRVTGAYAASEQHESYPNYVLKFTFRIARGTRVVYGGRSTWHAHDRFCRSITQGRICVQNSDRQSRGNHQRRTRAVFQPSKGRAIRAMAVRTRMKRTVNGRTVGYQRTKKLCGCLKRSRYQVDQVVTAPKNWEPPVIGQFTYRVGRAQRNVSVRSRW